jgi:hypothetical protein
MASNVMNVMMMIGAATPTKTAMNKKKKMELTI